MKYYLLGHLNSGVTQELFSTAYIFIHILSTRVCVIALPSFLSSSDFIAILVSKNHVERVPFEMSQAFETLLLVR